MQESVQGKETCMKALIFDPAHLDELPSTMDKIRVLLSEGEVVDVANMNRCLQSFS